MNKKSKAQSTLEYVALIAVVGAALATMQLYFKMGIQAGVRSYADYIGGQKKGTANKDYTWRWYHIDSGKKGVKANSVISKTDENSGATSSGAQNDVYTEAGTNSQVGYVGDLRVHRARYPVSGERHGPLP